MPDWKGATVSGNEEDEPPPSEAPRRKRVGGIRRAPRSPEMIESNKARGEVLYDPLARTWRPLGKTIQARRAQTDRTARIAEAEWLANHFQLDPQGRLPADEQAGNFSVKQRRDNRSRLTDFPRIPEGELMRLEGIIQKYGLPLATLSSDVAAFVVRRVMMDFHRLSALRRGIKDGMFTSEELLELLTVLKVNPGQFAEMVWPDNVTASRGNVYRWLHGISKPTGLMAIKVNRMIEQMVRRKGSKGGMPEMSKGMGTSDNPVSAARRERKYRQRRREGEMDIPLARSAQEEADANSGPDGGP